MEKSPSPLADGIASAAPAGGTKAAGTSAKTAGDPGGTKTAGSVGGGEKSGAGGGEGIFAYLDDTYYMDKPAAALPRSGTEPWTSAQGSAKTGAT